MCLGETRNNQGDRFVYDGKISKSKRKLLEGGINVFKSSFLRAKHILKSFRFVWFVAKTGKRFIAEILICETVSKIGGIHAILRLLIVATSFKSKINDCLLILSI